MKDKWIVVAVVSVIVVAAVFAGLALLKPENVDSAGGEVIARVGNHVLTAEDFKRYEAAYRIPPESAEREEFVETWIVSQLLLDAAMAEGGADLDQINWDVERKREELIITPFIYKLRDRFVPEPATDADVAAYYEAHPEEFGGGEQAHARHILVMVDPNASAEDKEAARAKAEDLLMLLQSGVAFADLAKERSDCPSASEGGDLGWFGRGQMVSEFEEVVFSLEPGRMSGVFESPFGYHIALLEEKQVNEPRPLDESMMGILRNKIEQDRQVELFEAYVEDLKNGAQIETDTSLIPAPAPVQNMTLEQLLSQ